MKFRVALFALCLGLATLQTAGAETYHAYQRQDTGEALALRYVHRHQSGEHLGVTVSDDKRDFAFYKTSDYGDHWQWQAAFSVPAALGAPIASGSWCWPNLWVFAAHYIDLTTYQARGQAWYSRDNGVSFQDLNALVADRFGESSVTVNQVETVDGGLIVIASEGGVPGQTVVRANSTKIWRLPLDAGSGPMQSNWELPLVNTQVSAGADGNIVGFGTDANQQVQIFHVGASDNAVSQRPASDLRPQMYPRVVHRVGKGELFTLADINTEMTESTFAAWSRDGVNWTFFQDSTASSSPDVAGYHVIDTLALDEQKGLICLLKWSGGTEGLGEVTDYIVKQTSDGGASWQTILQGAANNNQYGVSSDWDLLAYAFPMARTSDYRQSGQYVWPR